MLFYSGLEMVGEQIFGLHDDVLSLTNLCLLLGCVEDGKETTNNDAPENNPQYTTVYVGNLAPEARNDLP